MPLNFSTKSLVEEYAVLEIIIPAKNAPRIFEKPKSSVMYAINKIITNVIVNCASSVSRSIKYLLNLVTAQKRIK